MKPENFCYWLQGWLELQNPTGISLNQLQEIKNHLNLVFSKVTPLLDEEFPEVMDCSSLIKEKTYCGSITNLERKCSNDDFNTFVSIC